MAVSEFLFCRKSKFHFTRERIHRDDLPPKEVGGGRYLFQVIRHLVAPMPNHGMINSDYRQNPATLPCRSYWSARSIFAVTISPTFSGRRLDR